MTTQQRKELASRADAVPPERTTEWADVLALFSSNASRNHGIIEGLLAAAGFVGSDGRASLQEMAALAARRAIECREELTSARQQLDTPEARAEVERQDALIRGGQLQSISASEFLALMTAPTAAQDEDAA